VLDLPPTTDLCMARQRDVQVSELDKDARGGLLSAELAFRRCKRRLRRQPLWLYTLMLGWGGLLALLLEYMPHTASRHP
jgi:hypothetical protein